MSIFNNPDWRPPSRFKITPKQQRLGKRLGIREWPPQCVQCKKLSVWWAPACIDGYCEEHCTNEMKISAKKIWAMLRYRSTLIKLNLFHYFRSSD